MHKHKNAAVRLFHLILHLVFLGFFFCYLNFCFLSLFLFHKCEPGLRQNIHFCVFLESRKFKQGHYTPIREQKCPKGPQHFTTFAANKRISQMARGGGFRGFTPSLLFCSVRSKSVCYFNRFKLNPIHFLFKRTIWGKQLTAKDLLKALSKLGAWNYNPTKKSRLVATDI